MSEIIEQINTCCKQLRLRRLTDHFDTITTKDPYQFLLHILQQEVALRSQLRIDRSIKNAGFYTYKDFHDFQFDDITLPSRLNKEQLLSLQFIEDKQGIICYGRVGAGKTHLVIALGIAACKKGYKVGFWRAAALVNRLRAEQTAGTLDKFLQRFEKLDLVILDEWGYIPLHQDGAKLIFQVISLCYEKRSIMITTNLEFSKWVNIFYDEAMTTAMIDRLIHHSYLIIFDRESYRGRHSLMQTQE